MVKQAKALYLSHGGGPLPLLGDPGHAEMVIQLQRIAAIIERPKAILVVSAHWEEVIPTITAGEQPALIYDYYGFPEVAYDITYPVSGDPALAQQVYDRLQDNAIEARQDTARGFDHGLFVPLKIMYPEADIPCVQLSLVNDLDPARHLAMGRALGSLCDQGVLVIGSGFSFHNMRAFMVPETAESRALNLSFEAWLQDTCSNPDYTETERAERLLNWTGATGAHYCHPREEHLLPLHLCYGLAQAPCSEAVSLRILGKMSSLYLW